MRKIILAAVAASLVAGVAFAAPTIDRHWKGYISRTGSNSYGTWEKVEIFQDNNGCQYLVVTGGTEFSSTSYGVGITPRINSATKEPHCA